MAWSWADFEECPGDVVEILLRQIQEDAHEREAEKDAAELRRRHGR